ncbi:hypothetical protein FRC12_007534 [Ceratobasidium sp. 428]|nr:hypothetical protein FRC12_007534 [Ceratobasidium sp. 428]
MIQRQVASEIIAHLGSRNCPDLTDQLNHSSCSQYPISTGGYGEVYQGVLNSGESVALKSMIFRIGSSRSERELLKVIDRPCFSSSDSRQTRTLPVSSTYGRNVAM